MKQLLQYRKETGPRVVELPAPHLRGRGLVVSNRASLVSVGTERMIIEQAGASLIERARSTPDAVKKLMRAIQEEGVTATFAKVLGTSAAPVPLGYSCAGEVHRVHRAVDRFSVGDRVACGGYGYASHAEMVYVPTNLTVKIPDRVSFEEASFVTLGAIALQGVRLADVRLGERVAIIGLGLLGQLTGYLLESSGCTVIGLELDPSRLAMAQSQAPYHCIASDEFAIERVMDVTEGRGVDAVIVTAAAESSAPVVLAGHLARDKGKVVAVGAVRLDVPRLLYFNKELSLVVSRSYGPGRYDYDYEDAGRDYPYAYVRWTENRNMRAFLDLVAVGKVPVRKLITHRFALEHADQAYRLVTNPATETSLAVVLTYPEQAPTPSPSANAASPRRTTDTVGVGLAGAGSFAVSTLVPLLGKLSGCELRGLVSPGGVSAKAVEQQVAGVHACESIDALVTNPDIHGIIIASRHNDHCEQVVTALTAGKPVLVEKPLCLDAQELQRIEGALSESRSTLLVDFNRRFAPFTGVIMDAVSGRNYPLSLYYRVNGGTIPSAHWIQDVHVGGGRIVGEVCHFVDLLMYLTQALPTFVHAVPLRMPDERYRSDDNLQVIIGFADGSVGTVNYIASGTTSESKEYLEVLGDGLVARLDDFRSVSVANRKARPIHRSGRQDKGHRGLLALWIESLRTGGASPIPFDQIRATTLATFAIQESLAAGCPKLLDLQNSSRTR